MLLDIRQLAERIKEDLKKQDYSGIFIAMVLCGNDTPSYKYVMNKQKLLKEFGINYKTIILPETDQRTLNNLLDNLSADSSVTGIMLELPLPDNINTNEAISHIAYKKDVDGLTDYSLARIIKNEKGIKPCTVRAVELILDYISDIDKLHGKNVVIIGRSLLFGKPMSLLLTNYDCTCTLCHTKTKNIKEITKRADILIVAIGKKHYITKEFVGGGIVIDVGTNYIDNKLYGDVDFEDVSDENNLVTCVPGGVGVITKLCMVQNLIELYRLYHIKK